jgi:hypothetical protein
MMIVHPLLDDASAVGGHDISGQRLNLVSGRSRGLGSGVVDKMGSTTGEREASSPSWVEPWVAGKW